MRPRVHNYYGLLMRLIESGHGIEYLGFAIILSSTSKEHVMTYLSFVCMVFMCHQFVVCSIVKVLKSTHWYENNHMLHID